VLAFLACREQFDAVRQRMGDQPGDDGGVEVQVASIF
jgi:hypothetical protein